MTTIILLTLVAFLTAVLSGMTGLGGGTILVGVMFSRLGPAAALPLHAAVQLCSNLSRTGLFLKHLDVSALGLFLCGAVPSAFLMARVIQSILGGQPAWVSLVLAVFLLLATWTPGLRRVSVKGRWGLAAAGVIAGGLGIVVSATGAIIAPFFLREEWSKETVIGTKALCQASAHVVKLTAYSTVGLAFWDRLDLLLPMAAAVLVGTWLGKKAVGLMSERTFRMVFRVLLTLLALDLGHRSLKALLAGA